MQGNVNIPDSTITTNLSFKNLVLMNMQQLTNFPYIENNFDALTDYELLCLVVKFLNDVIANQNEQNASITRMYKSFIALQEYVNNTKDTLEDAFNELDDYVRNYFDNLDVQEEINNKLDQMLEDGLLEQIIEQFLQSTALWSFDTVAELKLATNLINGSYVKTLGYHTINDCGSSVYKVRTKTNNDVIDEMTILSLYNNTLVAEIVVVDKINVKQLGAYGDGENDDILKIQKSLDIYNYAYLTDGEYLISTSLTIHANGSIYGNNLNTTKILYSGNSNAILNEDVSTCTRISIHDLSIIGTNKTGNGIYLYRTSKNDDAYHQIYNLNISYFENGIYAGQYQNETKFNNLNVSHCLNGINFYYLNDCYLSEIVSHNNDKDGIVITGSSELKGSNIKCWYNGSTDNTYYNLNIKASAAISLVNISLQESYYDNLNISSCKNININNLYLSWAGLEQSTPINQIVLDDSTNCVINGYAQNGHYNVSGFDNNVLALKSHPYNCDVKIKTEFEFPSNQKLYLIGANNNFNAVFNRNNFEISNNTLKFNQTNYAKNGDISNTTSLSFVNNNTHCSYVDGKLRVDTTGETGNTNVYFQNITLPQNDFYTSYIKFKKVSGSGNVTFESPAYANIQASDEVGKEYYISMAKYSDTTKQFITLTIAKDIVIDISEFGIVLGESAKYDTILNNKAKV